MDLPTDNLRTFDELDVPDIEDIQTPFDMTPTATSGGSYGDGDEYAMSEYDKLLINMNADGKRLGSPESEIQTPYEAGQDQMQAMFGRGAEALWQASGGDPEKIASLTAWNEEQERMAGLTEIDGFGDKLAMALGQISVGAVPTLAAAVLAPVFGSTVATGTLVTGTLAEMLGGVGEVSQKALELDPEYTATAATVFAGAAQGAVGIPQLKRFTPALKPMAELIDDAGTVVLTGAERLAKGTKSVAKTAAISGATEAVQDVGTSLAAHALTDTVVDKTKGRAMAAAALDEFMIGGVLGGGAGVLSARSADVADQQAIYDAEQVAAYEARGELAPLQDETGQMDPDAIVPVPGGTKNPGTWNLFATNLFGKSTDYLRKKQHNNPYAQTFVQQIHGDPLNPQQNLNTVNEEGAIIDGNLTDIGAAIFEAPDALVDKAAERRIKGEIDMDNPIDKAMHWLYGKGQAISSEYNRVGRGNVDQSSYQWQGEDYLPNHNRTNWETIVEKADHARQRLGETMRAAGRTDEQIEAATKKLDAAIKEQQEQGNQMFEGHPMDEGMVGIMQSIVEEGTNVTDRMNGLIKSTRRDPKSLEKSPLNLTRQIPEAPQEFWEEFNDKGATLKDAIRVDLKKKAEHLAYADKFGFNNEVAMELMANAVIESNKPGNTPMSVKDLDNMMDILRLQQRLPTKKLTPEMRRAQLAIKSYTGTMILGSSALMSIPEIIITGYKTGIRAWAVGMRNTIKGMSNKAQKESLASMEDIGHSYDDAMSLAAARIGDTVNSMPKWETWFIQKMTGLPQVQYFLSSTTLKATDYNMRRQIETLRDPKATATQRAHTKRKLYQLGVNPDEAVAWAKRGYKKSDAYYNDVWMPKLYRELRTTIVEPHPVDKPVWMGAEHWFLISQLKSFVFTFQNLVLNDSWNKMRMEGPGANRELVTRAAPYLAMYILGQVGIMTLKEMMKGKDEPAPMEDKIIRAIGQQGVLSVLSDSYHAVAGRSGVLESISPAAGFASRQVRGNTQIINGVLDGSVEPENALVEFVRMNLPNTLIDAPARMLMQEAGVIQ